ncbi:MAG: hypothetical protein WHS82_02435 [Candidatus Methanosuratincola sp.]
MPSGTGSGARHVTGVSGALSGPPERIAAFGGAGFARASSLPLGGLRLATGCPALDSLTGGLFGGTLHLFSGSREFLDALLHSLLVEGCLSGNVAYLNSTDYYRVRSEISPDKIAVIAKRRGLDYTEVLGRILSAAAYSRERQPRAADALARAVRERGGAVLVAVHDISAFRGGKEGCREMDTVASCMWRLASETGAAVVFTSRDLGLCSGLVLGLSQVVVDLRDTRGGVRATLLRHPERETPASVLVPFTVDHGDGGDLMGRITPPFRQSYQELLGSLRGGYLTLIREPGNRAGFEALARDAWDREYAAMAASGIPAILDVMNLTANAHNRGEIEALKRELEAKEARIKELEARVAVLEGRLPAR